MAELLQVKFSKIKQTRSYTAVILGTNEKRFPIFTEPTVGQHLQAILTEGEPLRPQTHNLMSTILEGLNVRIKQVVINELHDTVFHARLFLEQERDGKRHILAIDARPSDTMTLALLNDVPIYCTRTVFDEALPVEE